MRSCVERLKCFFYLRQQRLNRRPVRLKGKMNGQTRSLKTWAHPEIVCCDRPDLGYQQDRRHFFVDREDGHHGIPSFVKRYKILRLQFVTAARGEVHFEMRKSFVPWA